ncbi:RNA polymerase II transcriptional coactivator KIWI-like [Magnolia sinica]|uniref:RNA polymerase II transcriptional coactivator KIWI-like n=1 Tax=Magnolia sinica TaxID=86752 RepID=UPI00265B6705|nr:RNA polymerase II transcriptional coactivator KIWI-like [Magnolia sinica]
MWRKGKRKSEEERFAGDGESKPPNKFFKKDDLDADDITICDISKNRRVSVRTFQGKVMVDIREFYMKDGKQMPGKKGISLGLDQWNILRDHLDEIDKAVAENA